MAGRVKVLGLERRADVVTDLQSCRRARPEVPVLRLQVIWLPAYNTIGRFSIGMR
jgi:hypothetical protein